MAAEKLAVERRKFLSSMRFIYSVTVTNLRKTIDKDDDLLWYKANQASVMDALPAGKICANVLVRFLGQFTTAPRP